jgi:hypothetical protein
MIFRRRILQIANQRIRIHVIIIVAPRERTKRFCGVFLTGDHY